MKNLIVKAYKGWLVTKDFVNNNGSMFTPSGLLHYIKSRGKDVLEANGLTEDQIRAQQENDPMMGLPEPTRDVDLILDEDPIRDRLLKVFDYSSYGDISFTTGDDTDQNLLIVDDLTMASSLYKADFNKISRTTPGKDVFKNFNVSQVFTKNCGFDVYKYIINNDDRKITHAMLDITFGISQKYGPGLYLELDGIDIAIRLLHKNPDTKITFISAHTLNRHNTVMNKYFTKFEKLTGMKIDEHFINKGEDRVPAILKFLYD